MLRRLRLFSLATVLLVGCSVQSPPAAELGAATVLDGSTSTFSAQAYYRWFNQLAVRENVNVELAVVGSGESIRRFLAGSVQFAGTDSAPSAQEIRAAPRGLLAFPVTAGAIAVAYNLPGCQLRLSRAQLADLFLGQITNFAALGCGDQPITLLHRRDSSGTTANFTAALAAISPAWRQGPGSGRLVAWPLGQAVDDADGMASALAATPGAVGYVESLYIRPPLQAAALQNRAGRYVRPDAASGAQAVAGISLDSRLLGSNPDPADGYPIIALNWMLVPAAGSADRLPALRTSLAYILSRAGQDDAEQLGFVPLPVALRERALSQLGRLGR
ncbi:MAG: substrate-binding domain-containing protein [Cyanobium sp.]